MFACPLKKGVNLCQAKSATKRFNYKTVAFYQNTQQIYNYMEYDRLSID